MFYLPGLLEPVHVQDTHCYGFQSTDDLVRSVRLYDLSSLSKQIFGQLSYCEI